MQENNAVAEIDLANKSITRIMGLGYKDHNAAGNGLDPTDKPSAAIGIGNYPIKGMYLPDAIGAFTGTDGITYFVTANEGDAREYKCLLGGTGAEREDPRLGSVGLDATAFGADATVLSPDAQLGRLRTTLFGPATLYNGDPASGGTAVSSAIVCDPWTAAAPIVAGGDTSVITSAEITFPSTGSSRTVTHVRFKRGASLVALDVALGSTVTLAANHALRADAGDFSAQLEWPYGLSGGTTPAELALRYLFADPTVDLVGDAAEVTISCYPATVIGSEPLDVFTVPRDGSTWDITGDTCGNAAPLIGTNIAPAGGWAVQILVASIEGVGTWFIRRERLISTGAGQPVSINTGILTADLNGL
jgi:hypothetical protein